MIKFKQIAVAPVFGSPLGGGMEHQSPGRVQGLGPTPPSCANWNQDERRTFMTPDWERVTCSECLRDRRKIERMWSDD